MKTKKIVVFLLIFVLVAGFLTGCNEENKSVQNSGLNVKSSLSDFENSTIGIITGSSYESIAKERFPNAELKYYSLMTDLVLATEQGKIDCFIAERIFYDVASREGAHLTAIEEVLNVTDIGFVFKKDSNSLLRNQMNEFVHNAGESGLLAQLHEKWFGDSEPAGPLDYSSLEGKNGTVRVAVSPDLKPISYYKDNSIAGYEVDLLVHFATEYGYRLELYDMTFEAILPGVSFGKYDIGSGGVNRTKERMQSVDFSDSHMAVDIILVTKDAEASSVGSGFWSELKESFHKTFIRENRWTLIAEGIVVTILISISAAFFGTLLGFGLYLLSRSSLKALQITAKSIIKVYSRIIAGTPVVVILMILFYVVFGSLRDISGVLVAIIGFTLTFGAFVCNHMAVSVGSVDYTQTEAAYALGYTKNKTLFKIILPQAMGVFLPSYCSQAVELLKATAVVGYIAVNDLTKMGDIIRSNTYEAFFPLIATAVIYFLLTWGLSWLLGLVKLHFEPKRRKKEDILKGVKTN